MCVVCKYEIKSKEEKGKKEEENRKINNQMKTCIGEMECPGEKLNGGGILRQCYGDLP